ncbi:OmpA family protein [Pseudorhodobacter sp.]|uniref:OmpA family protein n=1 Tax=Pseudorhodobacter sp. TaxID=1934400 RepID=UPI002649885C|nr:OmpA family protein [Pseudorhodobacter sp.]MDN5786744.1 OmpA family protein [Pseudorhodobacter sp.]
MRSVICPTAFAIFLASGGAVLAQTPYTTDELVEFYINSLDIGATRGICIGTPQECDKPAAPAGLDMLVTFELDSADLTAEAQKNLAVFAQMMQDDRLKIARFVVEGYTDARGTDSYNMDLSQARALSVENFLTGLGVSAERLSAIGFGKANPRTGNDLDPENRRVELRVDLR